jgi:hypothetical protein
VTVRAGTPFSSRRASFLTRLFATALLMLTATPVAACPFCRAIGPTLADQLLAKPLALLVDLAPERSTDRSTRRVRVVRLLVGTLPAASATKGTPGEEPVHLDLAEPLAVTPGESGRRLIQGRLSGGKLHPERVRPGISPSLERYLPLALEGATLPAPDRLKASFPWLNDPDPAVADDAHRVFGKASFAHTRLARDGFDRATLRGWIEDPTTSPPRIALYGFLLGVASALAAEPNPARRGPPQFNPPDGVPTSPSSPAPVSRQTSKRSGPPDWITDRDFLLGIAANPKNHQRVGLDGVIGGITVLDRARGEQLAITLLTDRGRPLLDRLSAMSAIEFILAEFPGPDPSAFLRRLTPALTDPDVAGRLVDVLRRTQCWDMAHEVLAAKVNVRESAAVARYALVCPEGACRTWLAERRRTEPLLVREAEQTLRFEEDARSSRNLLDDRPARP